MAKPVVEIFNTVESIFARATEILVRQGRNAISETGWFTLGLSGGRTPEPLYAGWVQSPLEWDRVRLFMVDERHVSYTHADSNWGMIRRALVDPAGIPKTQCYPIPYADDAKQAARLYDQDLSAAFNLKAKEAPVFDLMFMGLGPDGHTASLFPGTPALNVTDRFAVDVYPGYVPHDRVSLTFPVIRNARMLIFIVKGADKADRVHDVLIRRDAQYPATLACRGDGKVLFLLDRQAGRRL